MLNNKKSLLQRARIAMLAIVTILSISGSFAMTPKHSAALQTWGVLSTNGSSYIVTAITANSFCDGANAVCKVRSEMAPDEQTGEIAKSDAQEVPNERGNFQP
jgi:hypothetical protein